MDCFGQLPGAPGAAAELAQDPPGFALGIGAFAAASQPGMSAVGVLLGDGRSPCPPGPPPAVGQLPQDAPDPGGGQVTHGAGQRPGHPHDVAARVGDDLQVHPVPTVPPGIERPVGGDPVDGD